MADEWYARSLLSARSRKTKTLLIRAQSNPAPNIEI